MPGSAGRRRPCPATPRRLTAFFGDSSRGLTIINPIGLGVGLALGFALGAIPLPLPGAGTFTLGSALCCLLVGLVFGRLGRIGRFVTTLPFTVTAVLSELGLLMFLAQAGSRAGGQILDAFTSGQWAAMLVLGLAITLTVGLSVFAFQRAVIGMGGTMLAGLLAGAQTQPALLSYANEHQPRLPRADRLHDRLPGGHAHQDPGRERPGAAGLTPDGPAAGLSAPRRGSPPASP